MVCRDCRRSGHAPPNRNRSRVDITCYVCGEAMYKFAKLPQGQAAHYKCVRKYECRACGVPIDKGLGSGGTMMCFDHRNYRPCTCIDCGSKFWQVPSKHRKRNLCATCRSVLAEKPAPKSDLLWRECLDCEQWICNPRRARCREHYKRGVAFLPGQRLCRCGGALERWADVCAICRPGLLAERRREYRRKRGGGTHRARAKRFKVYCELVDSRVVYARDKWICGICHKKIDPKLKYPHPKSATLDHVIPLSVCRDLPYGPEHGHSYQNTQPAHWDCNCIDKGANAVGEQLALIG